MYRPVAAVGPSGGAARSRTSYCAGEAWAPLASLQRDDDGNGRIITTIMTHHLSRGRLELFVALLLFAAAAVAASPLPPDWDVHTSNYYGKSVAFSADENALFVVGQVFLIKLSALNGSELYRYQFGSDSSDRGRAVAIDPGRRCVYVVGHTFGVFAGDQSLGGSDGFIVALNISSPAPQELWRVQFGGSKNDQIAGVAVHELTGDIFISGRTKSPEFGTLPQSTLYYDAFMVKLNASGGELWNWKLMDGGSPFMVEDVGELAVDADTGDVFFGGQARGDVEFYMASGSINAYIVRVHKGPDGAYPLWYYVPWGLDLKAMTLSTDNYVYSVHQGTSETFVSKITAADGLQVWLRSHVDWNPGWLGAAPAVALLNRHLVLGGECRADTAVSGPGTTDVCVQVLDVTTGNPLLTSHIEGGVDVTDMTISSESSVFLVGSVTSRVRLQAPEVLHVVDAVALEITKYSAHVNVTLALNCSSIARTKPVEMSGFELCAAEAASAGGESVPLSCVPFSIVAWRDTTHVTYNATLLNLPPNTDFDVLVRLSVTNQTFMMPHTFRTLSTVVWGSLDTFASYPRVLCLASSMLTFNVTVSTNDASSTAFRACTDSGFTPRCSSLVMPLLDAEASPPADVTFAYVSFDPLTLTRNSTRTPSLGAHDINITVEGTHNASVVVVPSLPWQFTVTVTVEGTLLASVPAAVSSSSGASLGLEVFPAPSSSVDVTLIQVTTTPTWSTLFVSPPAVATFALGSSNPTLALELDSSPTGAFALASATYLPFVSGPDAALVTTAPSSIVFDVHNEITCADSQHVATIHLYTGQSTADVPSVTLQCSPALRLLESPTVFVQPGSAEASLTFSPTLLSLSQATPTQTLDVMAGASTTGSFLLSWTVSLSSSATGVTEAFFPVRDDLSPTVEVHARDRVVTASPAAVALSGTDWSAPVTVSLSARPLYALTVAPKATGFEFDPPTPLTFYSSPSTATSKTFRVRALAGTTVSDNAHTITYALGGSDAVGYAAPSPAMNVSMVGSVRLSPPVTDLFGRVPAVDVNVELSGFVPGTPSAVKVSLSGDDIEVTPSSFTFEGPSGALSQPLSSVRFNGTALRDGWALLTATVTDDKGAYALSASWNVTLHAFASVAFPPEAVPADFRPSTTAPTRLTSLLMAAASSDFSNKRILIGPADCANLTATLAAPPASFDGKPLYNLSCNVPSGVGAGLRVSVWGPPGLLAESAPLVRFAAPALVPGSLRQESASAKGQAAVFAASIGSPETVFMGVANVGTSASLLAVTFGPAGNETRYACGDVALLADSTLLQCTTEAGASGVDLAFRVEVGGQAVVGTDTLSFPLPPLVTSVEGCPTQGCPTLGGARINITIRGELFSQDAAAMSVVVGGQPCPVVASSPTSLTCTLPPGTGAASDIVVSRVFGNVLLASTASASSVVQFAAPEVTALSAGAACPDPQPSLIAVAGCPRDAPFTLTITGTHFGPTISSVLVGTLACTDVTVTHADAASDTQTLECVVPVGGKEVNQPVLVVTPNALSTGDPPAAVSFYQCPAGTFENTTSGFCEACLRWEFQQSAGKATCDGCPTSQYKTSADRTKADCALCPLGATCAPRFPVAAEADRWLRVDGSRVEALACPGSNCLAASACFPSDEALRATNAPAVSCCAPGRRTPAHANPLCGRCDEGFSEWGGECVRCDFKANVPVLAALVLVMWALVLVYHAISAISTGPLRIMIYFWQLALVFLGSRRWIDWASVINMNVFHSGGSSVCVLQLSARDKVLFDLLSPFLSFPLLALTALLHRTAAAVGLCSAGEPVDRRATAPLPYADPTCAYTSAIPQLKCFSWRAYARTAVALYLFTYNIVAQAAFDALNCVSIGDDMRLFKYPAVQCDASNAAYSLIRSLATVLGLLYLIAAPLALVWWFRRSRRASLLTNVRFRSVWGAVHEPFRESHYLWGVLALGRRAVLVALAVFMYRDRTAMFGVLAIACVLFLLVHVIAKPFGDERDNAWEMLSLGGLALLTIFQVMWDANERAHGAEEAGIAVVVLGIGFALVLRTAHAKLARPPQQKEVNVLPSSSMSQAAFPPAPGALVEMTGGTLEQVRLSPKGVELSDD